MVLVANGNTNGMRLTFKGVGMLSPEGGRLDVHIGHIPNQGRMTSQIHIILYAVNSDRSFVFLGGRVNTLPSPIHSRTATLGCK